MGKFNKDLSVPAYVGQPFTSSPGLLILSASLILIVFTLLISSFV